MDNQDRAYRLANNHRFSRYTGANPIINMVAGYLFGTVVLVVAGLCVWGWAGIVYFAQTHGFDINAWIAGHPTTWLNTIGVIVCVLWWVIVSMIFKSWVWRLVFFFGIFLL